MWVNEAFLDVFQNVKNETRTDSFVEVINYEICQRLCPTPLNEFKEVAVVAWLCKFPTVFQSNTKKVENWKNVICNFRYKIQDFKAWLRFKFIGIFAEEFWYFLQSATMCLVSTMYLRDIFSATAPHDLMEGQQSTTTLLIFLNKLSPVSCPLWTPPGCVCILAKPQKAKEYRRVFFISFGIWQHQREKSPSFFVACWFGKTWTYLQHKIDWNWKLKMHKTQQCAAFFRANKKLRWWDQKMIFSFLISFR